MGRTFEYDLPFPPTVNSYWKTFRGRTYVAPKGKAYRKRVLEMVERVAYTDCYLIAETTFLRPDHVERDIDNYHKALLDALAAARVYRNDSQIVRNVVEWQDWRTVPGGLVDPMGIGGVNIKLEEV